jgi:hypothetical protein
MLTNLRLADLRLTIGHQRTTCQNLPSYLQLISVPVLTMNSFE